MSAAQYPTYEAYAAARRQQGLQVLPRLLWKALKEGNPALVERAPLNIPATA